MNRVALLKVKLLLIRLEAFTNIILTRFGHIPEIREKCEEILDIIDSNKLWDNPIICAVLLSIFIYLLAITGVIHVLYEIFNEKNPLIGQILIIFIELPILAIMGVLTGILIAFECPPFP